MKTRRNGMDHEDMKKSKRASDKLDELVGCLHENYKATGYATGKCLDCGIDIEWSFEQNKFIERL